ncbi:hypothetical protein P691DRAFT_273818 [Macrolepiota fuliginosa MF-IS2]|uniref:Uncharacterized protein n=1 Tax=Macrolepiota fuliginosa MF-IS2 TaxID=1400762 RepID=A0A9P5X9N8_9AGAR|nr:hypothetical protein P691DRAFT_273818 [Macrolepiota fuliginosa MF-IS2]
MLRDNGQGLSSLSVTVSVNIAGEPGTGNHNIVRLRVKHYICAWGHSRGPLCSCGSGIVNEQALNTTLALVRSLFLSVLGAYAGLLGTINMRITFFPDML